MVRRPLILTVVCVGFLVCQASYLAVHATPTKGKPVVGSPKAKPHPKCPESTMLCGITWNSSLSAVIRRFGGQYKKTMMSVSGETKTGVIIYNDPKYNAHIVLDTGGSQFPEKMRDATVSSIVLKQGRIPGRHSASQSFADKGDYYGLTLNADPKTIKQFYPKAQTWIDDRKNRIYQVDVPSPQDNPCYISFRLKSLRVVEIFAGYSP